MRPKNRQWIGIVYLAAFIIVTVLSEIGFRSGSLYYRIEGFAVDVEENVYIGKAHRIDVYRDYALCASIPVPVSYEYSFDFAPGGKIKLLKDESIYYLSLDGEILAQETAPGNTGGHSNDKYAYADGQGNQYKYVNRLLGRDRIVKNGDEIVFTESRLNSIAAKLLELRFLGAILAFALIDGKGHPILWVKIIAKCWSERKGFRLNRFYRYYDKYYGADSGCGPDRDIADYDIPSWSDFCNSVRR